MGVRRALRPYCLHPTAYCLTRGCDVLTGDALRRGLGERIRWNGAIPELVEAALRGGGGVLTEDGALCVRTGKFTGRSPADKFPVHRRESAAEIDWSSRFNQPMAPEAAEAL